LGLSLNFPDSTAGATGAGGGTTAGTISGAGASETGAGGGIGLRVAEGGGIGGRDVDSVVGASRGFKRGLSTAGGGTGAAAAAGGGGAAGAGSTAGTAGVSAFGATVAAGSTFKRGLRRSGCGSSLIGVLKEISRRQGTKKSLADPHLSENVPKTLKKIMKRLLCVCLLVLTAFSSTGCTLLRKNRTSAPPKPKPVTALASDTDATFRTLWTSQRQKELVAQGLAPAAASAKAAEEYAAQYGYTNPKP
jgi:hypothetical protein